MSTETYLAFPENTTFIRTGSTHLSKMMHTTESSSLLRMLKERFKAARLHTNLTQEQLAEWAGMSQQGIQKIEDGRSTRPRKLAQLAARMNVTEEWLSFGLNPPDWYNQPNPPLRETIPVIRVPVIAWERASQGRFIDLTEADVIGWGYAEATSSPNTFALIMNNDDMDGLGGQYRIQQGARLLIDPDQTDPEELIGELVVVTRKDGACCLRELTRQAGDLVLKAWGDRLLRPVMPISEGWRIVGRMMRAEIILYQKPG